MSYIRSPLEEKTGFQDRQNLIPSIDFACDFVMVYGIDEDMPHRVRTYAEAGYRVHLMTGIAWGNYQDYLNGEWDGRNHWDEAQTDREGRTVLHNPGIPCMVPTDAFGDYLTEKLKKGVDAGVLAIHLEEPEFWNRSGYSPAFRSAYEAMYHEPFQPQHLCADAQIRCARLKRALYAHVLDQVSRNLCAYALEKYGRHLRFYVPTHSLINYCQWRILSPESALNALPCLSGFIAQVWTGTSRTPNVHEGLIRERTFETAFLEYGCMQELVRNTGRTMWFLHDPVEDNPAYTWENYREHYRETLIASLMHPRVARYEACTWPTRVMEGVFPRVQPGIRERDETSYAAPQARRIPDTYRTWLMCMFQMLGDMEEEEPRWENHNTALGLFISDTALDQRLCPQDMPSDPAHEDRLLEHWIRREESTDGPRARDSRAFTQTLRRDGAQRNSWLSGLTFPHFFGLAMPLLKYGLPPCPLQLDNLPHFPDSLRGIHAAILSYAFMTPTVPEVHLCLRSWILSGGHLLFAEHESIYQNVRSWWKDLGFARPLEHLLSVLGLDPSEREGVFPLGEGSLTLVRLCPADICLDAAQAMDWRCLVRDFIRRSGGDWQFSNTLLLRRGPYIVARVMDESVSDTPLHLQGHFADLTEDRCPLITSLDIRAGDSALLLDLDRIPRDRPRILISAVRILSMEEESRGLLLRTRGAGEVHAILKLFLPFPPLGVSSRLPLAMEWDEEAQVLCLEWENDGKPLDIRVKGEKT